MFRALSLLLALAATAARAQPWVDLGPSLGLPSQLQGSSGPSLSAGITAVDLDGDGRLELLASTPTLGLVVYTRVGATYTVAPDFIPPNRGTGLVFGHTLFDADGDGDLDLYVARDDRDHFFLFDSATHTFVDATDTHLPRLFGWSATATAADLDGDGDLDLLLARYIDRVDFPAHRCATNRIFSNDGRGVFTDTTPPSFAATRGCSFAIVAADYDDDLDLDLLVVNDFTQFTGRQELWENRGLTPDGALDLTEVSAERQLVAPLFGMGAAFDDLDQDGHPDLMLTSIGEPMLFTRAPDLTFRSTNTDKNLYARFAWDRLQATWTIRFLDLDADGHLDVLAAGGSLPAAPFIGNPPDQGAVILRGRPDGGLEPLPLALDLPRIGHSSRDFELADLTGDGIDELIAIHVYGRISVFENLERRGNRTRLELHPSTTGKNAAGARVSLTCAGISRTRRVNAGGDYGVHDLPRVDLSFPPPCAKGQPATGTIYWPSGLVQRFATTIGATLDLVEPTWFTLTPDPTPGLPRRGTLTLDLGAHAEPFDTVELVHHGADLSLSALTEVSPRRFTATWELVAPSTPDADASGTRLELRVDGRPWGYRPHITSPRPELSFAGFPVAGRALQLRLVFPPDTLTPPSEASATFGSNTVTLTPRGPGLLAGVLVLPSTPGPHTLVVTWGADRLERSIEVLPRVAPEQSELILRELHILQSENLTRRVRMRTRLHDANQESSALPLESLGLLLDGAPVEPDIRSIEAGFQTIAIEHTRLAHDAELMLTIDGVPHFAPQRVVQVERPDQFAEIASLETSRCWFSEPRARADGEDIVTALMQFADDAGNRLPDTGLTPTLSADGLRIIQSSLELGYGGWRVDLVAGFEPGTGRLGARLPGMEEEIHCAIELAVPPVLPDPITTSAIVSLTANPVVGQSMTVRMWPLGPDGRSLGSGVPLTLVTSDNAESTPVVYVGQGRYQALVTPRASGPVELQLERNDGTIIASTTLWEAGTNPDRDPDPDPDPDPEVSDDDTGPDPNDAEQDSEPGPESTDPEGVEPGPESDDVVERVESPDTPDTADSHDTSDPSDTGPIAESDSTPPDPDRPDQPDSGRSRDEGCGLASSSGTGVLLGLLGLVAFFNPPGRRSAHRERQGPSR